MKQSEQIKKQPLFHIVKRGNISFKKKVIVYAAAIFGSVLLSCCLCAALAGDNLFSALGELFLGPFSSSRKIWVFLQDFALLLLTSLALLPCFRMKFWNLGANGQILISALAACACMFNLGGKMSDGVINLLMIISALAAGIVWAVIPAVFKALFDTNESLLTLMLNYIAVAVVGYFITVWDPTGSNTLGILPYGHLPEIGNKYLMSILAAVIALGFMVVYFTYSKHGYEISVVGESRNTARYIGINVNKVIIRTLILSGAICGIIGLLLAGGVHFTVNEMIHSNMGFTGIMTVWLAKCNPLLTAGTCFLLTFLSKGVGQLKKNYSSFNPAFSNDSFSNIVLGIVYFCIIACDFFINYKIIFRNKKEGAKQ